MITALRIKIKSLVEDTGKQSFETFTYTNSSIFTLSEENITTILKVLKNGAELGTAEFSYDSDTNKIEIIASLVQNDIIEVDYTFSKYSDTELDGYIVSALVWISIYGDGYCKDFELEDDEIYPTPSNTDIDLICLVASIIIKPDWNSYVLPNVRVTYNNRLSKEEKIEKLITRFYRGLGVTKLLEL